MDLIRIRYSEYNKGWDALDIPVVDVNTLDLSDRKIDNLINSITENGRLCEKDSHNWYSTHCTISVENDTISLRYIYHYDVPNSGDTLYRMDVNKLPNFFQRKLNKGFKL